MQKFSNDVKSFKIFSLVPDSNCGPVLLFSIIKLGVNHIAHWSCLVCDMVIHCSECLTGTPRKRPRRTSRQGQAQRPDASARQRRPPTRA